MISLEGLTLKDITKQFIRDHFDLMAEMEERPQRVYTGCIDFVGGKYTIKEFIAFIKDQAKGSDVVDVQHFQSAGIEFGLEREDVVPETADEICLRLQKEVKSLVKAKITAEKEYAKYLVLKKKYEPVD